MSNKNFGNPYSRIQDKVDNGIFKKGENLSFNKCFEIVDIKYIEEAYRSPERCVYLINYAKCKLKDVPKKSRTREFYINAFTDRDVFQYISNHINEFDKQFFKDLIESNHYSLIFSENCFEIMPLEYIDEEMISLACLKATNWSDTGWFESLFKRKPSEINLDIWKCAARFYSECLDILSMCPEEMKDVEFYMELCSCSYNYGIKLKQRKKNAMDRIPKEFITEDFLCNLLIQNIENIYRITEQYLEKTLHFLNEEIKVWQIAIRIDSSCIQAMNLNEERINYFKNYYPEGSFEYDLYLKEMLEEIA